MMFENHLQRYRDQIIQTFESFTIWFLFKRQFHMVEVIFLLYCKSTLMPIYDINLCNIWFI